MQSSFNKSEAEKAKESKLFQPPEAFGSSMELDENDIGLELSSASSWDIATRYHEFKSRKAYEKIAKKLRKISAQAVLDRAQAVLGSVVHPVLNQVCPWDALPDCAEQSELDLEETLDQSSQAVIAWGPRGATKGSGKGLEAADIWMSYQVPRSQALIISVDTSLSMTGEKLALTAVALAVVLLQFPNDPIGIVAFENESKILKQPTEKISISELVERFLDVPAQGYTHLEDGMQSALRLSQTLPRGRGALKTSTVLLTDGKYTAGRDPSYLAPRFSHLVVLKMGKERASFDLCQELAQKGHGTLKEVGDLESLPEVMYSVVKDLLRGRSLS